MTQEELKNVTDEVKKLTRNLDTAEMLFVVNNMLGMSKDFAPVPVWLLANACRSINAEKVVITKDCAIEFKAGKNGSLKLEKDN